MSDITDKLSAWPAPPPFGFNTFDVMKDLFGRRRPPHTAGEQRKVEVEIVRRRRAYWRETYRRQAVVWALKNGPDSMTLKEAEVIVAKQLKDKDSRVFRELAKKLAKLERQSIASQI